MQPIHIDYAPKLIKWKNRTAFIEFTHRFYSPALFIVAFLSAFEWISYEYAWWLLPTLALISSIGISYYAWKRWKKDFIFLVEVNHNVPMTSCFKILMTEIILQFLVSILSFWWISGVPNCVTRWFGYGRLVQAYLWSGLSILVFILHLIQWNMSSREMDKIIRDTYDHLNTEV